MVIIFPLKTKFKNTKFITMNLISLTTVSIFATVFITIMYKHNETHVPSALCLPFIDPTGKVFMIHTLTWFLGISQLITSVSILVMHILVVFKLKHSQKLTVMSKPHFSDTSIIVQLTIISLSNILCWFSTSAIYITAMLVSTYPVSLIIWVTVLGLPINSVINPIIFMTPFLRDKVKKIITM